MKRQPVSLIGYDQMVTIFPEAPPSSDIVYPYISYNGATQIVTYHLSDTETIPYTLSVRESLLQNKESNSLESPELTFLLVGAKYDILLMFENLAIKNPRYTGKTGEGYMPRPRGIALVKEKR